MSRRRHARSLAAILVVEVERPERAYPARDVSLSGLFLLGCHWPVGSAHTLQIRHGKRSVIARGHVLRDETQGAALALEESQALQPLRQLLVDQVYEGAPVGDKRRAPRLLASTPVLWSFGHANYRTTLSDLSLSGAGVRAQHPPPLDTALYLYLPTLEPGHPLPAVKAIHGCAARVVRHTREGFAVIFEDMSEDFRGALLRLREVARQSSR